MCVYICSIMCCSSFPFCNNILLDTSQVLPRIMWLMYVYTHTQIYIQKKPKYIYMYIYTYTYSIMRDSIIPFCNDPLLDATQELPRIVGLTASFVNGKCQNLITKRHNLEALMQAEMWAPCPEQVLHCICVSYRHLSNAYLFKCA